MWSHTLWHHANICKFTRIHQNTSEIWMHIMHMNTTHQYTSVIITSRALHLHMRCSRTKDLPKLDDVGRSKRTSRTPSENWTTTDLNKPGQTLTLKTEQLKGFKRVKDEAKRPCYPSPISPNSIGSTAQRSLPALSQKSMSSSLWFITTTARPQGVSQMGRKQFQQCPKQHNPTRGVSTAQQFEECKSG